MKRLFFFMALFVVSIGARAGCYSTSNGNSVVQVNVPDVTVQRDAPVGTVLKIVKLNFPRESGWCDDLTNIIYSMVRFTEPSVISGVFNTNIPGIGIRLSTPDGPIPYQTVMPDNVMWSNSSGTVELVKTGEVAQSGELTAGPIMKWNIGDKDEIPNYLVQQWILSAGSHITALACELSSGGSMSFPIGDVSTEEFTQIGKVSDETSTADLILNCNQGSNINVTLSGTKNPDSSDDSILSLNNQGQNGIADGIGVQILYNNMPLKLNEMLKLKQSSGGQESFPLTARYIQTKNQVKAGYANATATLNISYQ